MTLFDNQCFPTVDGCIAYGSASDGSHPCLFCNLTSHFSDLPNSQGQCSCKAGYSHINGSCSETCGDGFIVSLSNGACDDGNKDEGDGCSSSCKTEKFYKCENGSDISPSVCVYRGLSLKISLNYTKRLKGKNSG